MSFMKKVMVLLAILLLPLALAQNTGRDASIIVDTEDFVPKIWMCGSRAVTDDALEPGRISFDGDFLKERAANYAFQGEQISWRVLVMDKNGVENIRDVYVALGNDVDDGEIEAECVKSRSDFEIPDSCNARLQEEDLSGTRFDSSTQQFYDCTYTVETSESTYGEYFVSIWAEDSDGEIAKADEVDFWFFNPVISLTLDGELDFGEIRPGTSSYSSILLGNDADQGSGVMMDMFISGSNFYDPSSSGTRCPFTNQLSLSNFQYYVSKGAYSTSADPRADAEGYVKIGYGDNFERSFYDKNEILQSGPKLGPYYQVNLLSPGGKMPLTFRLDLPEPCVGDFSSGSIFFWGEAV